MARSDLLIQVHIPKCAGTSVAGWLREAMLRGAIDGLGSVYPPFAITDEEQLRAIGLDNPRLTVVTTHNIQRYWPVICGRPVHYFTLLREPLAHFQSVTRFVARDPERYAMPERAGTGPRAFAEWALGQPFSTTLSDNLQTQHLTLHMWCATTNGRCIPEERDRWAPADEAAYRSERLALGQSVLRSFLAVGVVERLQASLEVVRRRSAAVGIHLLPPRMVGHLNATRAETGEDDWTYDDALGQRLRESRAVDFQLYAFAQTLLDEALAEVSSGSSSVESAQLS